MKLVYTSEDRIYLYHLKNILEAKDIECLIKNDNLSSLSGEIPMLATWPELWVVDSLKASWAEEIIADSKKPLVNEGLWECENCGEKHSGQFTDCWNCQNVKAF